MSHVNSTEEWRPVVGYEGLYEVSSIGRVRKHGGKMLKPYVNNSRGNRGYAVINLRNAGKYKTFFVHRLMLFAFFGPPVGDRDQCNHKNGQRADNRLENLEWCNQSENVQHAIHTLGRKFAKAENAGPAKLTNAQVREIREKYANRRINGASAYSLANEFHTSKSNIQFIVARVTFKDI